MITESKAVDRKQIIGKYLHDFAELVQRVDGNAVERVVQRLAKAREDGRTIYVAGNGGSAAIASHWVNDLGKATKCAGLTPMRVMSLSDNVAWLTALANDEGYERVFSGQLENFAQPGDVLVAISSSGNSKNLVQAVELAKARGLVTLAFLGFDGGVLRQQVEDYILVPTDKGAYGLVEPAHEMICHLLTKCLAEG